MLNQAVETFLKTETEGKQITFFGENINSFDKESLLRLVEWVLGENKLLKEKNKNGKLF